MPKDPAYHSHPHQHRPAGGLRSFFATEAAGGIVLMVTAFVALAVANSPLPNAYFEVLHIEVGGLSVLHLINDRLMALFFLLIGLAVKREIIAGRVSGWPAARQPDAAPAGR